MTLLIWGDDCWLDVLLWMSSQVENPLGNYYSCEFGNFVAVWVYKVNNAILLQLVEMGWYGGVLGI